MFRKILIANRGEIVCRISRTARRMGIPTVAVYSDADKYGLHVGACDEAVHIGPPPARDSYLVIDKIIEACRETGADAVHPGYGFLSENPKFPAALAEAGITFIGPGSDVIALMGDKIESTRKAEEAGVPVIPARLEPVRDLGEAEKIASEIGYPIMLKAAAGGGGKGILMVPDETELKSALRSTASEAQSSFGDDRVFIQKFIARPRHIEIQVLGDKHGHAIYLGERECSIQRRHQKVIEEAPSVVVDEPLRKEMGEAAVALAKAVGYDSAGTVELMLGADGSFYFLEMNTRLQVEHSVTEFVTGVDIVEWMIRIAAGEHLTIQQQQVRMRGWAVEARIYAEDPNRNFMPSTGRIVRYRSPTEGPQVRVDNGVYEGGEVSMFYDPMIAKVTTWDRDRPRAVALMRRSLDEFYIKGVAHNIAFLTALMANRRFLDGDLTTSFIEDEYPRGFVPAELDKSEVDAIVAAATLMHLRYLYRASRITGAMPGYERIVPKDWAIEFGGAQYPVHASPMGDQPEKGFDIVMDGRSLAIHSDWRIGDPVLRCTINAVPQRFKVERNGIGYKLFHQGAEIDVIVYRKRVGELARIVPDRKPRDMSKFVISPMPGLLRSVAVDEGDSVSPGSEVAVVEAMKMENVLKSSRFGRIATLHAKEGDTLTVGQVIAEFE
ncbi:MAG: acetyl-CoA carboxylase biotin carboxylase subunit [Rhodospirillales bacterium]|nr:acetyl-CoA carboxylase biotin carboxylase subunit [Rhodospirillales bacterium]